MVAVSCGDDCTAAVTDSGALYMWGRLHMDSRPQLVPLHVRGDLTGQRVVQVRVADVSWLAGWPAVLYGFSTYLLPPAHGASALLDRLLVMACSCPMGTCAACVCSCLLPKLCKHL